MKIRDDDDHDHDHDHDHDAYDDDHDHGHDHDHDVDDADAPAKLRNTPQNPLQIPYSENWVFGPLEGVKFLTGGIP